MTELLGRRPLPAGIGSWFVGDILGRDAHRSSFRATMDYRSSPLPAAVGEWSGKAGWIYLRYDVQDSSIGRACIVDHESRGKFFFVYLISLLHHACSLHAAECFEKLPDQSRHCALDPRRSCVLNQLHLDRASLLTPPSLPARRRDPNWYTIWCRTGETGR